MDFAHPWTSHSFLSPRHTIFSIRRASSMSTMTLGDGALATAWRILARYLNTITKYQACGYHLPPDARRRIFARVGVLIWACGREALLHLVAAIQDPSRRKGDLPLEAYIT